ncbi:MAG: hypothetical protein O2887_01425 [Bacteroidetes bacterium]|nr:hypothetical protein [Bacteroidota bacterium]MDA1119150.1 hypothetical protein [Bacteroidota bacterium]
MSGKVRFRLDTLFDWRMKFLAILILLSGLVVVSINYIISALLFLISVSILTGFSALEIDFEKKTYRRYSWLLGWKYGNSINFNAVDNIFINQSVDRSKYYSLSNRSTIFKNKVFNGWLKFSNEKKLHLFTRKNKNELEDNLKPIAKILKITILDHTSEN